jgi:catechol 2,3-dioxygenase-like lactoylglutathione lyase family enzyme
VRPSLFLRSMTIVGFDHVQLAAPRGCEEAARRFFGGVLGLEEIEKPEALRGRGGVWFAVGGQQLHVGVEEPHAPARKAHPALACDDLGAAAARVAAAGGTVSWDDAVPGVRRFYTSDPWGNRIELVSPRAPELLVERDER